MCHINFLMSTLPVVDVAVDLPLRSGWWTPSTSGVVIMAPAKYAFYARVLAVLVAIGASKEMPAIRQPPCGVLAPATVHGGTQSGCGCSFPREFRACCALYAVFA